MLEAVSVVAIPRTASSRPSVSVVMPSLNQEKFIEAAVKSVLDQDYRPIELIVADGGSTDKTISHLQELAKAYGSDVRWISERDAGPASAVNKALRMARGDVIGWLNSDDLYAPGAIARAVDHLTENPDILMVYGEGEHIDATGKSLGRYPTRPPSVAIEAFRDGCFICQPTVFMRRGVFETIGFLDEDLRTAFDFDLWLRIFKRYPKGIGRIDQLQAFSRLHVDCLTLTQRRTVATEAVRLLHRHTGMAPAHWFLTYVNELCAVYPFGDESGDLRGHLDELVEQSKDLFDERELQRLRERLSSDQRLALAPPGVFANVYEDGWAPKVFELRLRRGISQNSQLLIIRCLHAWPRFAPLSLTIATSWGKEHRLQVAEPGEFEIAVPLAGAPDDEHLRITITSDKVFTPNTPDKQSRDSRLLSFKVSEVYLKDRDESGQKGTVASAKGRINAAPASCRKRAEHPDSNETRILLDLKPALDGYAGIPQESRLLFRGLRLMEGYQVEGLIQHGARKLRAAIAPSGRSLSISKRVNKLSRVIVSLHEKPYSNIVDTVVDAVDSGLSLALLRLRVLMGRSLRPGLFEADLFDDFIWRTFFNKTLEPADKELVTSARYHVLRVPKKRLHQVGLAGLQFSSAPRYTKIDTRGFDVFLAQTPFPGRVSRRTQMVVRYHDTVPVLMPHTISDKAFHQASHFYSLQENVRAGAWFACTSESTRNDLLKIFPEVESRASVIHNMVSNEYFIENSPKGLVRQIIGNRLAQVDAFTTDRGSLGVERRNGSSEFTYLLMVSTIEPRKNHLMLLGAWERLKYTTMPGLKLVVVGNVGWDYEPVLSAFRPWAERGDLYYLNNVPSSELRVLYKHAAATICPSVAEGFDYSGIEAMRSGGIVISSDIPVHKEIYGEASEYFNPYCTEEAAAVIQRVLAGGGEAVRHRLRAEGARVSDRYTPHNILPRWDDLFRGLKGN